MKEPMVALLISPDNKMREDILSGRKRITLRKGHRDYRLGQVVMLCCHLDPWAVMADIAEVRHCFFTGVTKKELGDLGFQNHADMLKKVRKYYSDLDYVSPVTVIRWEGVRGKLVEKWRQQKFNEVVGRGGTAKE